MRFSRLRHTITALLVGGILAANCASVSLKERITQGVQAVHVTVGNAQDTEISLYTSGQVPSFTDADHKRFHAALVKFFDAEIKLVAALQVWRSGDPAPANVRAGITVAAETLTELQKLAPASFQSVLSIVSTGITQLANLIILIDGGK